MLIRVWRADDNEMANYVFVIFPVWIMGSVTKTSYEILTIC
jgi:hypothetical protein